MSFHKPSLVQLANTQNYKEIGAYLDSTLYTREEKVEELVSTKNKNEAPLAMETNSFLAMCLYHYRECGYVPLDLSLKAMRLLGENLAFPHYLHHVKRMMTGGRPMEEKVRLLEIVAEELDDVKHTEAMSSLLVHAVLCKYHSLVHVLLQSKSGRKAVMMKSGVITKHCFDSTKSTTDIQQCDYEKYQSFQPSNKDAWTFHSSTILEIAIHKKASVEIVQELLAVGGKPLITLSSRSLLQGAILECNNEDAFEIMTCVLEVGGKDLVMVDKSWKVDDGNSINMFQFLSIHHRLLFDHECDDEHALNRVYKIMNMLLKYGGNDAIRQKNTSGGSFLHDFQYFGYARFLELVKQIIKIGRMELMSVQDEHGDSILHVLARYQQEVFPKYWELFAKKELVMLQNNKGQTALHLACKNSATIGIEKMLAQGGKDLARMQDNEGNTALHYVNGDGIDFPGIELVIQVGGMNLLHCRNNKQKKALDPVLIRAIAFQPEKKKLQASVAKLEEKINDMEEFKHKHQKDTSQIKDLQEINKSQRNEIDEVNARMKEKDIELKNVKAENENRKANETFLVEQLREMKGMKCRQTSSNEQEKNCKDLEQNASLGKKHVLIEDNYNTASKKQKKVTFATDHMIDTIFNDLNAMKQEIKDLKMEKKDLASHFLERLKGALKEM